MWKSFSHGPTVTIRCRKFDVTFKNSTSTNFDTLRIITSWFSNLSSIFSKTSRHDVRFVKTTIQISIIQSCCNIPPSPSPILHVYAIFGSICGFGVRIYVVNFVVTNNLCFKSFACTYQCEYGSHNDSTNVVDIHDGLVREKDKLNKKDGNS